MDTLTFCRDGVLRRNAYAYDHRAKEGVRRSVPLLAWEKAVDGNVFLKSLHADVLFEENLTVGELMENLAPWARTMTGVACMDFPAFLAEARKGGGGCEDVSHLEIGYQAQISPVAKFKKKKKLFTKQKDGMFRMNIGKPLRSGKIRLEESWDCRAVLTEEGRVKYDGSESVSLSFTPVSEYAHVPVRFSKTAVLTDESASANNAVFLDTDKPLTKAKHPNVSIRTLNGRTYAHDIGIVAPTPRFFDAVIRGLFWEMGFNYSPAQRDAQADELKDTVEKVEAGRGGEFDEEAYAKEKDREFEIEMARILAAEAAAAKLGLDV